MASNHPVRQTGITQQLCNEQIQLTSQHNVLTQARRELILHVGITSKVIPLKLILDSSCASSSGCSRDQNLGHRTGYF